MTRKVTISVPDELHEKMEKWRGKLNFSGIFQEAIACEIHKKELFKTKLEEEKTLPEIWGDGNLDTPEGQYAVGKEMGFAFAKTAPYPEIKQYEQYAENWDAQEPEELDRFHYNLDIISILDRAGIIEGGTTKAKEVPEDAMPLTQSFDMGFMVGIIEFIREECSSIETSKLVFKRDPDDALQILEISQIRIPTKQQ